jgi:hypothetical protein
LKADLDVGDLYLGLRRNHWSGGVAMGILACPEGSFFQLAITGMRRCAGFEA